MSATLNWSSYAGPKEGIVRELHGHFKMADLVLQAMGALYGLTTDVPRLVVHDTEERVAQANPAGEIQISTGLLSWLKEVEAIDFADGPIAFVADEEGGRKTADAINGESATMLAFLSIVVHEFAHFARGHFNVLSKHNPHYTVSPLAAVLHPLEIDADGLAAAGIYRSLGWTFPNFPPISRKTATLLALFWPLRAHIGSALASAQQWDTHPSWHLRIGNIISRLAHLDQREDAAIQADARVLLSCLLACERRYAKNRNIQAEDSPLVVYLRSPQYKEAYAANSRAWEKIAPDVFKMGYLAGVEQ